MSDFVSTIEQAFKSHENKAIALQQSNYMRNRFEFFGLKSQTRRELQRAFLKSTTIPSKSEMITAVVYLWGKPQRELHYVAQELAKKYIKHHEIEDLKLYEYMVIHKSWWDTVDFIASNLIGSYFRTYPEQRKTYIEKWLNSENIWLQRSAILFQLKYKNELDTELLVYIIRPLLESEEFFINKAIGWILREYSKTNPVWVKAYVSRTELSNLSKKEALRLIT